MHVYFIHVCTRKDNDKITHTISPSCNCGMMYNGAIFFNVFFFLEINLILRDVHFHHAVYRPRLYQFHVLQDVQCVKYCTIHYSAYASARV